MWKQFLTSLLKLLSLSFSWGETYEKQIKFDYRLQGKSAIVKRSHLWFLLMYVHCLQTQQTDIVPSAHPHSVITHTHRQWNTRWLPQNMAVWLLSEIASINHVTASLILSAKLNTLNSQQPITSCRSRAGRSRKRSDLYVWHATAFTKTQQRTGDLSFLFLSSQMFLLRSRLQ